MNKLKALFYGVLFVEVYFWFFNSVPYCLSTWYLPGIHLPTKYLYKAQVQAWRYRQGPGPHTDHILGHQGRQIFNLIKKCIIPQVVKKNKARKVGRWAGGWLFYTRLAWSKGGGHVVILKNALPPSGDTQIYIYFCPQGVYRLWKNLVIILTLRIKIL